MTSKITTRESRSGFATGAESRARWRFWRKPFLRMVAILVGLGMCAAAQWSPAQTNSPELVYPANRYLLVVETSRAMQQHTNVLFTIVRQLVGSKIAAQAHHGDTLGFWTYNEDVYHGVLPLQKWSMGNTADITERVAGFLSAQKFEKVARLDKVTLDRLNKNSQFITVILICLGDTDVQGTPFDDTINQFLRTWRKKEHEAGAPFVIALRGQAGTFVDYTLNPSPWPAELPVLPKELLTPSTPVQPVAAATNKPPAPTVPSLIVSGRKHQTTQTNESAVPATLVTSTGSAAATNAPASIPGSPLASPIGSSSPPTVTTAGNPASEAPPASAANPATLAANTRGQPASPQLTTSPALEKHSEPGRASNAAGPQTAEATAGPPAQTGHLALVVTGVVSVIALLGAVILWQARPRRTADTSIITESFDRRKK